MMSCREDPGEAERFLGISAMRVRYMIVLWRRSKERRGRGGRRRKISSILGCRHLEMLHDLWPVMFRLSDLICKAESYSQRKSYYPNETRDGK